MNQKLNHLLEHEVLLDNVVLEVVHLGPYIEHLTVVNRACRQSHHIVFFQEESVARRVNATRTTRQVGLAV